ncbi:phosphodiesterase [Sphingomonas antarctica]|uniref:phosphodiesterase n=1 Tax=Sphingomonas antarctica TaxID=2040274 RepID=UPI0039E7845C
MVIAQVTDIHLGFDPGNADEFNRQRLDATLGALTRMTPLPDLLLATGDLVDRGDAESYAVVREAFGGLPFPVLYCMGNHDDRTNFASVFPELGDGDFVHYVHDVAGLRLVVIDTLEDGRHGGGFCTARAAWLTARLAEAPDTPTIIVMHHPPVEAGIEWMNTDPREDWVETFAATIAGHDQVRGIICGHLHRSVTAQWEGITVAICASTAPQVALELAPIDADQPDQRPMIVADPPAYALHRWNGAQLVTLFETADDHVVLARFDERMQPLVRSLLAERPVG